LTALLAFLFDYEDGVIISPIHRLNFTKLHGVTSS
jgi:hypothetical protein